jgi:hypothetical protein
MMGLRRKLLAVNGGPGSMVPTKFGNEELGGKFGKGLSRLEVALAAPLSTAFNANGGLRANNVPFPSNLVRFAQMPYPPRRTRALEERGCHAKRTRGSECVCTG